MTVPVLKVAAVHLHLEPLIQEYYWGCGQMDTETWTIIAVRQAELTLALDAAPSGHYMVI